MVMISVILMMIRIICYLHTNQIQSVNFEKTQHIIGYIIWKIYYKNIACAHLIEGVVILYRKIIELSTLGGENVGTLCGLTTAE